MGRNALELVRESVLSLRYAKNPAESIAAVDAMGDLE